MLVEIPFLDENGDAYMPLYRTISRKPKHLPRIGESVYVLPNFHTKVKNVMYSGSNFSVIHILLEPIPFSRREELQTLPNLKGIDRWRPAYISHLAEYWKS